MPTLNDLSAIFEKVDLSRLGPALLILVLGLILIKLLMKFVNRSLERLPVDRTLHTFLRSTIYAILYGVLALVIADALKIPITSLVALLSVVGLAFSLAIQGTLSNLAGGIMVLTSKPFVVGDFVEAGGVSGTVEEIGLVYTRLNTADNKRIFVPNSEISSTKILNYTAVENRRIDLSFGISYDDPVDQVKAALMDLLACDDRVLDTPAPFIGVNDYLDSSIQYVVRCWVPTDQYWDVRFHLLDEAQGVLARHGITMTYNHLNVHLSREPDGSDQ
ncbi:MAG: mechanosensitive ion channel family protein [Eubacteriales bacterium]|jgi:small conductance mechanosensitive channel